MSLQGKLKNLERLKRYERRLVHIENSSIVIPLPKGISLNEKRFWKFQCI